MPSISTYTTSNGKRYRVRYRYPNGSQTDKRGFKTKNEAHIFLHNLEVNKQKGVIVTEAAGRQLIKDLAEEWLQTKINLKPSSLERNKVTIKNQINPFLGDYQIKNLNHASIQKWINHLTNKSSPSTVRKAHRCLSQMLDMAILHNKIINNPANKVTLPKLTSKEPIFLTVSQLKQLALASGEYQNLILFLGLTGLRFGEMAALRVDDWDSRTNKLRITKNLVTVNNKLILGTPKTGKSRTIIVPKTISVILNKLVEGKNNSDSIFVDPNGKSLTVKQMRNKWFSEAKNMVEVPKLTIHDLRHTAASIAISSGANVKVVQQMLGHASAAMTLDIYGGLFEEDMVKTAINIERYFNV